AAMAAAAASASNAATSSCFRAATSARSSGGRAFLGPAISSWPSTRWTSTRVRRVASSSVSVTASKPPSRRRPAAREAGRDRCHRPWPLAHLRVLRDLRDLFQPTLLRVHLSYALYLPCFFPRGA